MRLLIAILIALIIYGSYIRYVESNSIFFPTRPFSAKPEDYGLAYENIIFKTKDRKNLHGWLIKNPAAQSYLLFFHGNAGNIADRLDKVALFQSLNLNVFIVDYRGYGRSQGKPSEPGLYLDALAAFDYLRRTRGIDPYHIVVYGASLGAVAAIDVATKRDFAGLIIDSGFTSAADMCKIMYPRLPTSLLRVKLDSVSKISRIKIPKLFIHSVDDETVPLALGQKLFDAALEPKEFLTIRGPHMEGYQQSRSIFVEGISRFLNRLNVY